MSSLEELHDLMTEAANTPPGKTAADLWAKAAGIAESGGYEQEAVICYVQLTSAYAVGGQGTRVIAPFIWCDKKYRERPDLFPGEIGFSHAWHYKYVVGAVRSVPTVPVAQCESLLEEMRQFYLQQGDGMRAYYIRKFLFEKSMGTEEAAEEAYQAWYAAPESELSDCPRCDPGYEVSYYARAGNWEKAVAVGEEALSFEGDMCDSQPEALLTTMMEPWSRVGNDASAWAAHTRAYRRYQESSRYLEDLPVHLSFLYLSGMAGRPERIERGIRILLRHLPWWTEAETPRTLMELAIEGALLFSTLLDNAQQQLNVELPGADLPWVEYPSLLNPTAEEAYQWMRQLALKIAKQFDERPGLIHKRAVTAVEKRLHPQLLDHMVSPQPVPDAAGLFTKDENQYAVLTSEDKPNNNQTSDSALGNIMPVALDLSWKMKSINQLFQSAIDGYGSLSADFVFLFQKLSDPAAELPDNAELTAFAESADEAAEIIQTWETFLTHRYDPWNIEIFLIKESRIATAEETLIAKLRNIHQANLQQDYETASLTTIEVLQLSDLKDPLGVRLFALNMLGDAKMAGGDFKEATNLYRQLLNLYAALGVTQQRVHTAYKLAFVLQRCDRAEEALDVLQSSLDAHPQFHYATLNYYARVLLAELYEELNYKQSALRELQLAYPSTPNEAEKTLLAQRISDLATNANEYQLAIEYQQKALEIVESLLPEELSETEVANFETYSIQKAMLAQKIADRPGSISSVDKAQAQILLTESLELQKEILALRNPAELELAEANHVLKYVGTYLNVWGHSKFVEKLHTYARHFQAHQALDEQVLSLYYIGSVHIDEDDYAQAQAVLLEAKNLCADQVEENSMLYQIQRMLEYLEQHLG